MDEVRERDARSLGSRATHHLSTRAGSVDVMDRSDEASAVAAMVSGAGQIRKTEAAIGAAAEIRRVEFTRYASSKTSGVGIPSLDLPNGAQSRELGLGIHWYPVRPC